MHIVSISVKQKLLQFLIDNLVLLGLVQLCHPSEHFSSRKSSLLDLTYMLHTRFSKSVLQYTYCKILYIIELFHQPTLMNNFLYSLTICLLRYYPRHVSSINMPIFRRKNCIHTASGIFVLCKRLPSTLVESGLSLNQCTGQTFTESEDTRYCVNTIFPHEMGMLMLETCRG